MNKLTVMAALALATLVTFNANAAEKAKGEAKSKAEGKERPAGARAGGGKIAEELNLTTEQKPKVEAVMKDAADKRKALRDDTTLTPEKRREKAKTIAEESKAKLKEILTAEQQAKMEKLQKERPARGEGAVARKKAGAPAEAPAAPAEAPAKTK